MKAYRKALAMLALVPAIVAGNAQTAAPAKESAYQSSVAPAPSIEDQIQSLRREMEGQIQQLQQELADRTEQLQQAQQAAAAAQSAADQAQRQAAQQAAASHENAHAISGLQAAQVKIQDAADHPDVIHYKGISLSPSGSFLAAETVYRSRATGGAEYRLSTGIPLNDSAQGQYSEFYGSGRQSRVAMFAEGKVSSNLVLHGYYEADWLSSGTTSNNNQSNSYTMRQRQLWAQAQWGSLTFTGGQMWSLAAETTKGLQNKSEILPSVIDPQYTAGFVWARQYGFRVTKDFGRKFFLGVSAENAQIPSISGHNLPFNFVVGQPGTGGGLYNSTANYASSVAPDFLAKLAFEPGWGHYEVFGIGRFFRARVYPNAASSSAAGAYNDTTMGGGLGGSLRVPTLHKHLDVGLKGLWGDGIGRYGSSQIADTTVHPDGQLALIHGFSALGTLEYHATPRLDVYLNYGGDYAGRRYFITAPGKATGYGSPYNVETGCDIEAPPASGNAGYTPGSQTNCTADTKDVQEFAAGYWFNFYNGPKGRLRQGVQYSYFQRQVWPGIGTTPQATNNMFWTVFRYYLP